MRRHLAALALLGVLATPVPASAGAIITEGLVNPTIPNNNDFKPQLTALGYNRYTSTGASIWLTEDSFIDFYILASESGNANTFVSGLNSFAEDNINHYAVNGLLKFTRFFSGGFITPGDATLGMGFTSSGSNAQAAELGDPGFAIFEKTGWVSGVTVVDRFIIGYDDQITGLGDDNHDDLMVLAVVRAAVPEPGTWAMLLFGFGALGAAMRRKSKDVRVRAAIA
jgi:hypothetical protein